MQPSGTVLGGRYRLDRQIGRGATATVYLAEDLKHRRQVAVKVLDPDVAASLGSDRFLREIDVAARFSHPHILPLHDSGTTDGLLFYVTPYVEGESLRQHLQRHRMLPIEDAVRIARQVASALDHAHRQGVVHRDIKPENILLQDGVALVADFGVAGALAAAGAGGLTQTGVVVGTPAYMSPEQITGRGDLDGRSDLYALGCVLYEMLAGERPFAAASVDASLSRRLTEEPPRVSSGRPSLPPALDSVIAKTLARTPADRFPTALRFVEALDAAAGPLPNVLSRTSGSTAWRWMAFAALGASVVVYALTAVDRRSTASSAVPRLVVLPFENLGAAEDEYFADGITDELTARLAGVSGLDVIARQSAVLYKKSGKTPQQIGEELDADYVLEATVSWQRGQDGQRRIRVRPQLIRASDATSVWADVYDEDVQGVFDVQTRIARSVASGLDVVLLDREQTLIAAAPTRNREAHDFYLRALQYANPYLELFEEHRYRNAIPLFEQAIVIDPEFAAAHAGLGQAHMLLYFFAVDRTEARLAAGKNAVDRALARQPDLLEARLALAFYFYTRFEYADAMRVLDDLRAKHPNHAHVLFRTGLVLRRQGKMADAAVRIEEALRQDPRAPMILHNLGETYALLRNYAAAETWLARGSSLSPDAATFYWTRGRNLVAWKSATADAWQALNAADKAGLWSHPQIIHCRIWLHVVDRDYARALDLVRAGPVEEAFDWQFWFVPRALWIGEILNIQNQAERARPHYALAARMLEERVKAFPTDPRYQSSLSIAYAGLGRRQEAIQTAKSAVALIPTTKDAFRGAYAVESLARVHAMTGDRGKAVQLLTDLIATPSPMSAGFLRCDPRWDVLRGHPDFEQLLRTQ